MGDQAVDRLIEQLGDLKGKVGELTGSFKSQQETLTRIQGLLDTEFTRRRRSTPAELPAIAEARAESKARTKVLIALASLLGAVAGCVGSLAAVG